MRGASVRRLCLQAGAALLAGCVHLPPELARELQPAPAEAPDHYRPIAPGAVAAQRRDTTDDAPP